MPISHHLLMPFKVSNQNTLTGVTLKDNDKQLNYFKICLGFTSTTVSYSSHSEINMMGFL